MISPLEWVGVDVKVGLDAIEKVEAAWNVKLPLDFVECVMENNGGSPSKDVFDVPGNSRVINRLLRFNEDSKSYVLRTYGSISSELPNWVFPIASDVFGNMICLDYRQDMSSPSVVFWDHEEAFEDPGSAITYVAGTFSAFLAMLRVNDFDPTPDLDLQP